jgi:2-oxoglutarate dehydrogenase E2 component (dihydrolipoamide succinyltransferase)
MIEIILPAMGEGIIEAEITRWLVAEGRHVQADEPLVEVATDKVDSEITSPGIGILHKILLKEGDTAKVGQVLALIGEPDEKGMAEDPSVDEPPEAESLKPADRPEDESLLETEDSMDSAGESEAESASDGEERHEPAFEQDTVGMTYKKVAFLSPLVRRIAVENGISPEEIESIPGSGAGDRITRADITDYLARRPERSDYATRETTHHPGKGKTAGSGRDTDSHFGKDPATPGKPLSREQIYGSGPHTIEEMDRMRRLIADHMVYSMQTAPHVTSFVESDVTEMIRWRERLRDDFQEKYGQKLTLTTLILEAVIKALKEYPGINVSVDGNRIIVKHDINIGMAAALPDGNLIVPVIRNADKLNLGALAARVNDLAGRARENRLKPAEIQGGTFTVTNMGQFGNIAGTPIINQPQAAILAVGAVVKKPAVVETSGGDGIGIRHMMILSLAYDHRVIDGALGGSFLKAVGDKLQNYDPSRIL